MNPQWDGHLYLPLGSSVTISASEPTLGEAFWPAPLHARYGTTSRELQL